MSAISNFLTFLRSAIYAIDVRDGIADAIEQCYNDVNNPTLKTEALEAALQTKIDEGEMAALTIGDGTITAAKFASGVIDNTLATSGAAADAKKTGDEIAAVKADLGALENSLQSQTGIITKVNGSYISLITDPVSLTPVVDAAWSHSIVSCAEGDTFIINAEGGQKPRAWGFLDSSNHAISVADASTVVENLELTAPANATKLIINDKSGVVSYVPSAYLLTKIADSAQGKVDVQQSPGDYGKALVINRDGQVRPGVVSGGSGLTDNVKVALLACFRHVLWDDEDGNYYNALKSSLYASDSRLTAIIDYGYSTVFADDPLAKIKWMLKVYYDGVEISPRDYTLEGSMIVGDNVLTVTYNGESTTVMVEAEESLPRRISFTAGELLKYNGLGVSASGGIHKVPYLIADTNHRVYYTAKGHAPYFNENNGVIEGVYPIPIPAWATHVKASVAPHSYEVALNCWRYNNSTFDYSFISGSDSGFHAWNSESDVAQLENNARAVNVIIQRPSGTDAFDPSTEATEVVVQFT